MNIFILVFGMIGLFLITFLTAIFGIGGFFFTVAALAIILFAMMYED